MMARDSFIDKRFRTPGFATLLFSVLTISGLSSVSSARDRVVMPDGVQLPEGMPTMPEGVSPYGVRRPDTPGRTPDRRRDKEQPRRKQPDERPGSGLFEIRGRFDQGPAGYTDVRYVQPSYHTVRPGDTLWDISETYFRDPWFWPRLWAMNPSITNPHWIYPGDRIRLKKGEPRAREPVRTGKEPTAAVAPRRDITAPDEPVSLRRRGYIEEEKVKSAGVIRGSSHEKILLATYDVIYIDFKSDNPLEPGKRYTIFEPVKEVFHPADKRIRKQPIGRLVSINADVEIRSVKWRNKDKTRGIATGVILRAVNPVERGHLVGDITRTFEPAAPIRNTTLKDVEGVIVEVFDGHSIIGTDKLVFIDKGGADKIKRGHVFFAVRRGDAYRRRMDTRREETEGEKDWPVERVASLVVVEVDENHSAAVVRDSRLELQVGDTVRLEYSGPE